MEGVAQRTDRDSRFARLLSRLFNPSPILIKEMRSTMRGARTFIGITIFLLFLATMSLLVYYGIARNSAGTSAMAGRMIFGFVSVIEALTLAVVTPTLTAGAIASERQKQTFDMLMATPLTARQVLGGKLLASMNYLFLLMLAGLPINAIVFLFGGISPTALLWWVALVVVVLVMLGALGLLMSTLFRSSGVSTAITYLICVLVFVVLPLGSIFMMLVLREGSTIAGCAALSLAMLHPAGSLAAVVVNEAGFNARMLLPATLPLYSALAGLLFLGAEARLSALVARRWRRVLPVVGLLIVLVAATIYVIAGPVLAICNS